MSGKNSYYKPAWRSPEKVQERHVYIVALFQDTDLKLKEIALAVKERFGAENGKGPHSGKGGIQDHSTISAHLKKHERRECRCFK